MRRAGVPGFEFPGLGCQGLGQASGFYPLLLCLLCGLLGVPKLIGISQGEWLEGEVGVCRVWTAVPSAGSALAS